MSTIIINYSILNELEIIKNLTELRNFLSNDYIPKLLAKYPNLKLTGAWNSQIGVLDNYGKF